jgi:hypothetical protein
MVIERQNLCPGAHGNRCNQGIGQCNGLAERSQLPGEMPNSEPVNIEGSEKGYGFKQKLSAI